MKKLITLALVLLASMSLHAQTTTTVTGTIKGLDNLTVTSGRVDFTLKQAVDTTISGSSRFTTQTVSCKITGTGIKASDGTSACTITKNTSLTPAGTYYQVDICPYSACTSQVTMYAINDSVDFSTVVPSPGNLPVYTQIDTFSDQSVGGTKTFTGDTFFKSVNSILFADQFANLATVAATAGTINKTLVIIPSSYSGSDCLPSQSNLVALDFRGNSSINCPQNTASYNMNDGTVNAMVKEQMTVNSIAASGSAVARWILTYLVNGTGGSTLDGASTEAVTLGAHTGTIDHMTGNESVSLVQSTGGTITEASGIQGYVTDTNTRTTAISAAAGLIGIGCYNMTGTPKPVDCYGIDALDQTNQASGRNYSIFMRSRALLGYSAFASNGGLDMEDSSHVTHNMLYTTGTDLNLRAIGAGGLNLIDNAGSTQARVLTTGLTVSNHLITPDVKIGTSGTVITDSRNLVQYSTTLSTAAVTSEGVSMPGVTTGSKCAISPTNATAATNIATTYISAKNTDSVVVTHTATAGMTYDILCTAN